MHTAIQQLIKQIQTLPQGYIGRISQPVKFEPQFPLLDWLASQSIFPQVYFQFRDTEQEVITLGSLQSYNFADEAYSHLSEKHRLWGIHAFDPDSNSCFFLPALELVYEQSTSYFRANLLGDNQKTIDILKQISVDITKQAEIGVQEKASFFFTPDQSQWAYQVNDALDKIRSGHFEKVVLARQTEVRLKQPINAIQLLKKSKQNNKDCFHFLYAKSPQKSFIGSTPERLFLSFDDNLYTEALAGTIGRGKDSDEDDILADWLLHDTKNNNENQLVVDDIQQRLEPLSKSINIDRQAHLLKLSKVQHLKRAINAKLNSGVSATELLSALQPTAAISGLPRQEAYQYILDNERFARYWYSGSFGYLSHQTSEFCVTIRSAMLEDDRIIFYAGAGIVEGSNSESEWRELNKKTATLLNLIDGLNINS